SRQELPKADSALEGYVSADIAPMELIEGRPAYKSLTALLARISENRKGNPSGLTIATLTGFLVLMDAFDRARSVDPRDVRKALANTRMPATQLLMPWLEVRFNETGQNIGARYVLRQVRKGQYTTVYPAALAKADIYFAKNTSVALD